MIVAYILTGLVVLYVVYGFFYNLVDSYYQMLDRSELVNSRRDRRLHTKSMNELKVITLEKNLSIEEQTSTNTDEED